jgi:hypothetical protein
MTRYFTLKYVNANYFIAARVRIQKVNAIHLQLKALQEAGKIDASFEKESHLFDEIDANNYTI